MRQSVSHLVTNGVDPAHGDRVPECASVHGDVGWHSGQTRAGAMLALSAHAIKPAIPASPSIFPA